MFKTIVLATDGSKEAEKAEQTAIELARENGAKLVLVHINERIAAKVAGIALRHVEVRVPRQQLLARQLEPVDQ